MAAVLELFENVDNSTIIESLLLDHRQLGSRAHQGGGSTLFQVYWDKCYEILHNHHGSAAHERRTASASAPEAALYCSAVHLISHLVDLATQALRQDVKDGKIESVPLIFLPLHQFVSSLVQMMTWQISARFSHGRPALAGCVL
jgi:hypothetical protein